MCHLRSKSTVMAQFSAKGQGRGAFFAIRCNCKLCMLPPWHFVEWFSGCCTMQLSTWVVLQQNPSVNSECFECAKLHKQCDSGWKVNTSRQNAGCTNDHWNFSRQNEPHWTKTTAKSAPHCQNLSDAPIDCKAKTIGAIFWNHLLWQKKVPNRKHLSRNECSSSQTPIPAPTSTLTQQNMNAWQHSRQSWAPGAPAPAMFSIMFRNLPNTAKTDDILRGDHLRRAALPRTPCPSTANISVQRQRCLWNQKKSQWSWQQSNVRIIPFRVLVCSLTPNRQSSRGVLCTTGTAEGAREHTIFNERLKRSLTQHPWRADCGQSVCENLL